MHKDILYTNQIFQDNKTSFINSYKILNSKNRQDKKTRPRNFTLCQTPNFIIWYQLPLWASADPRHCKVGMEHLRKVKQARPFQCLNVNCKWRWDTFSISHLNMNQLLFPKAVQNLINNIWDRVSVIYHFLSHLKCLDPVQTLALWPQYDMWNSCSA